LASDVQVANSGDRDKLRFSLTGESGLNDGTAMPMALLGLGLIAQDTDFSLPHWFGVQTLWNVLGGGVLGAVIGSGMAKLVLYLRTHQREAIGMDEFFLLGLLALSWGLALIFHCSTFLAAFCAGQAVARSAAFAPRNPTLPAHTLDDEAELATDPQHA